VSPRFLNIDFVDNTRKTSYTQGKDTGIDVQFLGHSGGTSFSFRKKRFDSSSVNRGTLYIILNGEVTLYLESF
jgi:hypothetical protein